MALKENSPPAPIAPPPADTWAWLNPKNWFLDGHPPAFQETNSQNLTPNSQSKSPQTDIKPSTFTLLNISDMQNGIVSRENLTQQHLAEIFSNAYFDVKEKDGKHFIRDVYSVWIEADEKGRFVKLESIFKKSPNAKQHDVLDAVNAINADYIMFRVYSVSDVVIFEHYIWVEGGVLPKAIVQTYKFFNTILPDLVGKMAEKNVID